MKYTNLPVCHPLGAQNVLFRERLYEIDAQIESGVMHEHGNDMVEAGWVALELATQVDDKTLKHAYIDKSEARFNSVIDSHTGSRDVDLRFASYHGRLGLIALNYLQSNVESATYDTPSLYNEVSERLRHDYFLTTSATRERAGLMSEIVIGTIISNLLIPTIPASPRHDRPGSGIASNYATDLYIWKDFDSPFESPPLANIQVKSNSRSKHTKRRHYDDSITTVCADKLPLTIYDTSKLYGDMFNGDNLSEHRLHTITKSGLSVVEQLVTK